jgi:uncharacterized membrane protein YagU involved in acid resistance
MTHRFRNRWWTDALRGAIAGAAATWLMDQVTTAQLEAQSEETTRREQAAQPNGKSSVANLVDRIETRFGLVLDDQQRAAAAQAVHYGLGIVPGAAYAVLRPRVPLVGSGRGVGYGIALWASNDVYAHAALGLSGPVDAYPMKTHRRGLIGHVVLGGATDTVIALLGSRG